MKADNKNKEIFNYGNFILKRKFNEDHKYDSKFISTDSNIKSRPETSVTHNLKSSSLTIRNKLGP